MQCHQQEDTSGYRIAENSNLEHLEEADRLFQAMRGQQIALTLKNQRLRDGVMAQGVKCLQNKHEELNVDSQIPHRNKYYLYGSI